MSVTMREATRPDRPGTRGRVRPSWPLVVLAVATVGSVLYLLSAYVPPDMATSRIPPRNELHYGLLVAHIFTGSVAALTGFAQFWPWLRRRYPVAHRWTGRAYFFLGVFPSSLLVIPVAVLAPVGAGNQTALGFLDFLWILSGVAGYRAIRLRRFADHRRWMIRNYALTVGSIATRLFIPVMLLIIAPQQDSFVYQGDTLAITHDIASGSAWLGIAASALIAEWYIQRRYGVPAARRPRVES